jgi:hypothetical protein
MQSYTGSQWNYNRVFRCFNTKIRIMKYCSTLIAMGTRNPMMRISRDDLLFIVRVLTITLILSALICMIPN